MIQNQSVSRKSAGRILRGSAFLMLMGGAALFLALTARAADSGYIRIIGPNGAVDGGSKDAAHMNWTAVSGTSSATLDEGVKAPRDVASGMASGKRIYKAFTITKEIDKATPLLTELCASGKHIPEVDVDLGTGATYKLTDVIVSSIHKSTGGDRPMETVSFTYQKIEMSH